MEMPKHVMSKVEPWDKSLEEKCRLANDLYLSLCNAIELTTLRDHGQDDVARLMWKMLRRHQLSHFLPGLKKLGLDKEPSDAVKSGKYHYFSNILGGLEVHYMEESPEKVWIRYPGPYSMSDSPFSPSVGIAAFAPKMGHATFSAWHAHNGTSLGNPRLGFVLTRVAQQGDPHHEGYFKIFDYDLGPDETLQFSPGERGPRFDPAQAPKLTVEDWGGVRKARALRNYAVEYVDSHVVALLEMYGVGGARSIVEHASKVTMAQLYKKILQGLDIAGDDSRWMAIFIQRDWELLHEEATVEEASGDRYIVRQKERNPRLFPPDHRWPVEIDEAFLQGWRVLLEIINPDLTIDMTSALTAGDPCYEWVIRPRRL